MRNHFISKHRKWLIYGGLFFFFLLWQWNGLVTDLQTGFDMGVQNMELLTAASDHLHYGEDLLVTPYPPLSWLYKGVVPALTNGYGEAVFQSFVINILSALLRVAVIESFWKRAKDKSARAVAIFASVLVFLRFSVQLGTSLLDLFVLATSLLICRLLNLLRSKESGLANKSVHTAAMVIAVSILLSVPQLVKFSYIAMAAALLIIAVAILLAYKRYVEIPLLLAVYGGSTCLLWILSGERLRDLPSYTSAMLRFVSGYSEVMSLPFSAYENAFRDLLFALAVCVSYGFVLLYLLLRNRKKAAEWFVIAPFIFLIFKESFVRSDSHTSAFMGELPFVLCYLLFVFQQEWNQSGNMPSWVWLWGRRFCCGFIALLMIPALAYSSWYPTSTAYSDFGKIGSRENFNAAVEETKDAVRSLPEYQVLLEDIEPYPDKTLGMLSGEQTFLIANDLIDRFKLNPIVSLWENFTSHSELAAAGHYSGDDAPDILLYRPEPLDGGYFVFRMGTILRSLLENYYVEKVDENGYLVLSHHEQSGSDRREAVVLGEPFRASVGSPVEIPTAENAVVFMKIDWKLNVLGKLASFILKPPQTQVLLQTEGEVREYRFFRTLASNGLYVSSFVDTPQDLANLINSGLAGNRIESITLQGDTRFYQSEFEVSFYAVPYTLEQTAYQDTLTKITADFSTELPAGRYQFFYAQDGMFTGEKMETVSVPQSQTQVAGSIPRSGWNSLRLDFPSLVHEYDLLSISCNGMTAEIDGANNAEVIKTENGWHVKTGEYDPFIVFHLVE